METEFCAYEQSLALKELGFGEPCFKVKLKDKPQLDYTPSDYDDFPEQKEVEVGIPLYQQAFRFFREKYPYRFYILPCSEHKKYLFEITLPSSIFYTSVEDESYNTYEEAENSCLDKLIEIVKTNNK
jgi:hypothetical protein